MIFLYLKFSDKSITLVKHLQTPFEVKELCYKISVLETLRYRLLHFELFIAFLLFYFIILIFALSTDPLSQERVGAKTKYFIGLALEADITRTSRW